MRKWYPCELHCHTLHSDGSFTVNELIETAKERHLEGICLTDHNTVSGWEEADKEKELTILKGTEYTTYHGHILSLNAGKIIDCFDITDIDKELKVIRDSGGLVGIAHPFQLGTPICTGGRWDYKVKDFSLVNYMEIWSEGEMLMTPANNRAKSMWLSLLGEGYRIAPTFGRDWHRTKGNKLIGACTCLLIEGDITPEKMKKAIREGRTQITLGCVLGVETDKGETVGDEISAGERSFTVDIDKSRAVLFSDEYTLECEKIRVITKDGKAVYEGSADEKTVRLKIEEKSFYIFELWGKVNGKENQLLAMTGAIYT